MTMSKSQISSSKSQYLGENSLNSPFRAGVKVEFQYSIVTFQNRNSYIVN